MNPQDNDPIRTKVESFGHHLGPWKPLFGKFVLATCSACHVGAQKDPERPLVDVNSPDAALFRPCPGRPPRG